MVPRFELDPGNHLPVNEYIPIREDMKFVRIGEAIAVRPESLEHQIIALKEFEIPGLIWEGGKILVDDGGIVFNTGFTVIFEGTTTTCKISGDEDEARQETERVWEMIVAASA